MAYLDNTGLAQVWFKVCARIDSKVEGAKGKSLYQSWLDTGHTGTEADFVKDMKGKPGDPGEPGEPGKSAYDLWKEQGNEGTVTDFFESMRGPKGDPLKASTRTVTLDVAGWPSDRHRIAAVEGVTATNTVIVTPAPESIGTYGKCGVYAAAQGEGSLTFVCAKQPEESLTVNMLIV